MGVNHRKAPLYTKDVGLLDEIETMYSYILDECGKNVADPISANMGYFNNSGKVFADPPKVGRTVIYMTRPNLNFRSYSNIQRARAFNYLTSNKLGATLCRMLMYSDLPNYMSYGGGIGRYTHNGVKFCKTFREVGNLVGTCNDTFFAGIEDLTMLMGQSAARDDADAKHIIYSGGIPLEQDGKAVNSFPMVKSNFIPMITNLCYETSGGRDLTLNTDETEGDYIGNKLVYAAGMDEALSAGELTLNFHDIMGSPVLNLMLLWEYYMNYVSKNICIPERPYLTHRIVDYTVSIYVFMLDMDQTHILRWCKYGGCFPRSVPFGNILHNHNIDFKQLADISIPFAYNFFCPNDPLVLQEFNMISEPGIIRRYDDHDRRQHGMTDREWVDYHFAGMNHHLSEDAYLDIISNTPDFPASERHMPAKMITPKTDIPRVRGMLNDKNINTKLYTNPNDSDGLPGNYIHQSMGYKWAGKFSGGYTNASAWGQPYIVDGNKLVYF